MGTAGADVGAGSAREPVIELVARLRAERDGLRRAMQSRSVIEQAKGVLMARHTLTADQAFARLLDASQRSNTRLAQVAAGVVAGVSPLPRLPRRANGRLDAATQRLDGATARLDGATPRLDGATARVDGAGSRAGGGADAVDRVDAVDAGALAAAHTQHLLILARLRAAASYDDIAAAVAEVRPAPNSVVLLLREADGALRLVADRGLHPDIASQWGRIPPNVQVPLTDAVRCGTAVWITGVEEYRRAYPLLAELGTRTASLVAMPLVAGCRTVGALGLTWTVPGAGGDGNRAFLTQIAEVCGPVAMRISRDAGLPGTEDAWLRPLLNAALDCSAVLAPVRDGDRIIDLVVEHLNDRAAAWAGDHGVTGERPPSIAELFGGRTVTELLGLCQEVLFDGRPGERDDVVVSGHGPGQQGGTAVVRAVRLGDRVVLSWRAHTGEPPYDDLLAAERAAGVAAFRWHPWTGQWSATPTLTELVGWPRGGARLTPVTAGRAVGEAHWRAVRRATVTALRGDNPTPVGVATRHGRWLRITLAPVEGGVRGTVQDITELRSALARFHGHTIARTIRP